MGLRAQRGRTGQDIRIAALTDEVAQLGDLLIVDSRHVLPETVRHSRGCFFVRRADTSMTRARSGRTWRVQARWRRRPSRLRPGGRRIRSTTAPTRTWRDSVTRNDPGPSATIELSTLFRRIRDEARISSGSEAARRAGITQATVSRWEWGRHVPTAERAAGYARALGARPDLSRELVRSLDHGPRGEPRRRKAGATRWCRLGGSACGASRRRPSR